MRSKKESRLIDEVLALMAEQALREGGAADRAVERFSGAVDRLLSWFPADGRDEVLLSARSHSYCTAAEIARMRTEIVRSASPE